MIHRKNNPKSNSGIYKITNKVNNKIYIGSTCCFKERKSKHKTSKTDTIISKSIQKYGWNNFIFEIIEYCDVYELEVREQFYLDLLQPFKENNGYNILRTVIGNGWRGHNHTEESKKIMSEKKQGYIPWNKDKIGVQEHSLEARKLMSINTTGEKNPFYNKNHTKETKEYLSFLAKNRDMSRFNKRIIQIDKNTQEVIKIWESITNINKFYGISLNNSSISRVCKGKQKTAYGFCWKYY